MPLQAAFTLTANEIYNTVGNMIISQEVFGDNLGKHQTLVDKARVEGGLFGDTKLYYATDVLKSHAWGNDSEASNLLALDRPADPEVQDIRLDVFRQIRLTLDNYLSKRAWSTEGAFASFSGIMLGWMRETKRVYEGTLYNAFIGTTETSTGSQAQTVDLRSASSGQPLYGLTGLEKYRMKASLIAQHLADLLVEMGDYSRAFNDYQYLRSYAEESIIVIWNSKFLNEIRKVDLPTIFHKEGLVDKFEQDVLPERYFGRSVAASDKGSGKVINASDEYDPTKGTIRSRIEADVTVSGVDYHVFAGDEIPSGATVKSGGNFEEAQVYVATSDVICKVLVKLPPIMSAFEVGTTFFNPRSLTENHYLTWGHNTLKYFKNYPFITVKADE